MVPGGTAVKLSRRALVVLSTLTVPALASCGGTDAETTPTGASDGGSADPGAFPATISHLYGDTEIVSEPQRIATVSWVNGDSVLALGLVPVGMPLVEWGGNENSSTDWSMRLSRSSAPVGTAMRLPPPTPRPTASTS